MDYRQDFKDEHAVRVEAYRHKFEIIESAIQAEVRKHPKKYGVPLTPQGKLAPTTLNNISSKIQSWAVDRMLGEDTPWMGSAASVPAGTIKARDRMQVGAFHSFFRCALDGDETIEVAFAMAVVKSSDDAFDEIWDRPERRKAFRKWLKGKFCHSQPQEYDFEQHDAKKG